MNPSQRAYRLSRRYAVLTQEQYDEMNPVPQHSAEDLECALATTTPQPSDKENNE